MKVYKLIAIIGIILSILGVIIKDYGGRSIIFYSVGGITIIIAGVLSYFNIFSI